MNEVGARVSNMHIHALPKQYDRGSMAEAMRRMLEGVVCIQAYSRNDRRAYLDLHGMYTFLCDTSPCAVKLCCTLFGRVARSVEQALPKQVHFVASQSCSVS